MKNNLHKMGALLISVFCTEILSHRGNLKSEEFLRPVNIRLKQLEVWKREGNTCGQIVPKTL